MFQIRLESSWNSGESVIRFGGASREARGDMCSTLQGKARSLWLRLRLEGLIGEQDDSTSLTVGNLDKEPPDSSNDAAESSGDSRLGISGSADKKLFATTRTISNRRVGKEQFTLQFCWRRREGAVLEREERRVVLVVLLLLCSSSNNSSSNIWYKQILSHVEGEEEEEERKSYRRRGYARERRG